MYSKFFIAQSTDQESKLSFTGDFRFRIEQDIDKPYITQLVDAYTRLFHYYTAAPLLIVNATEIDLTHSTADFDDLLQFLMIDIIVDVDLPGDEAGLEVDEIAE